MERPRENIYFRPTNEDGSAAFTGPAVPISGQISSEVAYPAPLGPLAPGPDYHTTDVWFWRDAPDRLHRLTVQQIFCYVTILESTVLARNREINELLQMIHRFRTEILSQARDTQALNSLIYYSRQQQTSPIQAEEAVRSQFSDWVEASFPQGIVQIAPPCPYGHAQSDMLMNETNEYFCAACWATTAQTAQEQVSGSQ